MKWILWTLAVLVALVVVVIVIGWLLPAGHEVSRTVRLNKPPEAVYAAISDVAQHASWWPDVTRVEMLEATGGKIRFREHTTSGPIVMEVDDAQPPAKFVTRIADSDQPFGGTWTFDVARDGGGSRLTITERGEVYNPLFRFMSKFIFGHTATMESYLRALGKRFGESVEPA
jgi:uncharacterized protein YndB with AHSA1/START domain